MASEIVMPRLGWTMETGKVAEWLKQDGDMVQAGEVLFTVESDKALNEVEALESGILRFTPDAPPVGAEVPVGAVLAYLVQPGDRLPAEAVASSHLTTANRGASIVHSLPDAGAAVDGEHRVRQTPAASPRARRVARELGVDWKTLQGSGRTGRIVERDVRALADQMELAAAARVTPLARRLAAEAGVDLNVLATRMPGQRITRADVETAAGAPAPAARSASGTAMSQVRRLTTQRMAASAQTAASVTLTTEADATELVRLRIQIRADLAIASPDTPAPTYNDLLIRLVALALLDHPALNSSLDGASIIRHEAVHIGLAVDTVAGLLVPVMHNAHLKSVQHIAAESARLIALTRANKATLDDLSGGTFTISNLGMYEIDAFTPLINLPECAILGVGRIVSRLVVLDDASGETAVRKMLALSLSFDHRVVDGAPAARFLQHVKHLVEHPYAWVMR